MTKNNVMTVASEEMLAELRAGMPVEEGFTRIQIPRIGMFSQHQTEEVKNPKTKKTEVKVISEAGTFYLDQPTDEENEEGKKVWEKTELGEEIEGIIIYQRKQLKYFNAKTGEFASSAVYDSAEDVIPLFQNGAEIAKGTPAELKALEIFKGSGKVDKAGNEISKLEDNRILYVIYEGEMYQMNLRGTSMYSWMAYSRKVTAPGVLTKMNSIRKENGDIKWNQMTFEKVRTISTEEYAVVKEKQQEISSAVEMEKSFYASRDAAAKKAQEDLDAFDGPSVPALPAGKKK